MIFLYIFSGLLFIFLIVLLVIYFIVFFAPKMDDFDIPDDPEYLKKKDYFIELIKELRDVPYQEVRIKAKDHKILYGKLYKRFDTKEFAICFHGYKGTAIRDFAGGGKLILEMKTNFLFIDERGQGKSGGHFVSFGIKEKEDVLSWVNYVNELYNHDVNISLYGVSMGASTLLMASGTKYENVKRIIADSPFSDPKDVIKSFIDNRLHLSSKFFYPLIYLSTIIYGGYRLDKYKMFDELKNTQVPVLIIHGEADNLVPSYMSETLEDASPLVKRETFPNASHALSLIVDPKRYKELIYKFIEKTK